MSQLMELSPEFTSGGEQTLELLDPDTVALNGATEVVITMANCVKLNDGTVCVDALVCADMGCRQ